MATFAPVYNIDTQNKTGSIAFYVGEVTPVLISAAELIANYQIRLPARLADLTFPAINYLDNTVGSDNWMRLLRTNIPGLVQMELLPRECSCRCNFKYTGARDHIYNLKFFANEDDVTLHQQYDTETDEITLKDRLGVDIPWQDYAFFDRMSQEWRAEVIKLRQVNGFA